MHFSAALYTVVMSLVRAPQHLLSRVTRDPYLYSNKANPSAITNGGGKVAGLVNGSTNGAQAVVCEGCSG